MKTLGRDYIDAERATPLLKDLIDELEAGLYAASAGNA